ncbi:MAG: hypothetical protein H0T51_04620 [Pirellulales bacterium]|nr:hypothetical protein [Pirellulales bacterium]
MFKSIQKQRELVLNLKPAATLFKLIKPALGDFGGGPLSRRSAAEVLLDDAALDAVSTVVVPPAAAGLVGQQQPPYMLCNEI